MTSNPGCAAARRVPHRAGVAPVVLAAVAALALLAGCGSDAAAPEGSPGTASDPAAPSSVPSSVPSSAPPSTEPAAPATSSAPAVPAGTPACDEVWVADATLPRRYRGCAEGDVLVAADRLGCSSGQALIRYDDRFWAVAGGLVREGRTPLLEDPVYVESVEGCRA